MCTHILKCFGGSGGGGGGWCSVVVFLLVVYLFCVRWLLGFLVVQGWVFFSGHSMSIVS